MPRRWSRTPPRSPQSASPGIATRRQSLREARANRASTPPPPRATPRRCTLLQTSVHFHGGADAACATLDLSKSIMDVSCYLIRGQTQPSIEGTHSMAEKTSGITGLRSDTPRHSAKTSGHGSDSTRSCPILVRPRAGMRLEPLMSGSSSEEEEAPHRCPSWAPPPDLRAAQLRALGFSNAQLAALAPEAQRPSFPVVHTPAAQGGPRPLPTWTAAVAPATGAGAEAGLGSEDGCARPAALLGLSPGLLLSVKRCRLT